MKKIIFVLLFSFESFSLAQSMKPGLWKTNSSFKLNGIQLPGNETQACISADEAKDAKETITKSLKKDGCQLTKWAVKDRQLEAGVACNNKDIEARGSLRGTLAEKSYSLEGDAEGTFKKVLPSVATLKLTGTWVKGCKK